MRKDIITISEMFTRLNNLLAENQCKHAQILQSVLEQNGHKFYCAHIIYLDNPKIREKVSSLIRDAFRGEVYPIKEGKTYVDFVITEM